MDQSETLPQKTRRGNKVLHYKESDDESSDDSELGLLDSDDEGSKKYTCGVTKNIKKIPHRKKKYKIIPDGLREKLIEAVQVRGEKIKQAAKKLRINYSSAKSICQIFKKEGRSSKKTFKKRSFEDLLDAPSEVDSLKDQITVKIDSQAGSDMKQEETTASFEGKQMVVEKEELVLKDNLAQKVSFLEAGLNTKAITPLGHGRTQIKRTQAKNNSSPDSANSNLAIEDSQIKGDCTKIEVNDPPDTSSVHRKQNLFQQEFLNPQLKPEFLQFLSPSSLQQPNNFNYPLQRNYFPNNSLNQIQPMLWNLNPQDFFNYAKLQQNLNFMHNTNLHSQHPTFSASQYPFPHLQGSNNFAVNNGYLHLQKMASLLTMGTMAPQIPGHQKENKTSQSSKF